MGGLVSSCKTPKSKHQLQMWVSMLGWLPHKSDTFLAQQQMRLGNLQNYHH